MQPFLAADGAHVKRAFVHDQVAALHQFDAHLIGEEGVLEISGVVDAGCQHGDGGIAVAMLRAHAFQGLAQQFRIALDRGDPMRGEQFWKQPHHGFAVFQHVRHAGRGAEVVFEHIKSVFARAHDVDADNMGIDVGRRVETHHFRQEGLVLIHHRRGDFAGAHDFLTVIDIVQEGVQRPHPLLDAPFQEAPFGGGDDAGNQIEWNDLFVGLAGPIHRESDAEAAENRQCLLLLLLERCSVLLSEPGDQLLVGRARCSIGPQHFIEHRRLAVRRVGLGFQH